MFQIDMYVFARRLCNQADFIDIKLCGTRKLFKAVLLILLGYGERIENLLTFHR